MQLNLHSPGCWVLGTLGTGCSVLWVMSNIGVVGCSGQGSECHSHCHMEQPGISQMAENGLSAQSKSCRELARNNVVAVYIILSLYMNEMATGPCTATMPHPSETFPGKVLL